MEEGKWRGTGTEPTPEYREDKNDMLVDSVWKAKYEELEKRYDQLLSILGGGMRQTNVG